MKKILIALLILISFNLNSQTKQTNEQQVQLTVIEDNYYSAVLSSGSTKQTGYYILRNDKLIRTGRWIQFDSNNNVIMKGVYKDGKLDNITVYRNGIEQTLSMEFVRFYRTRRIVSN